MQDYLLKSVSDYKLMSQTGLKQFVFPMDSDHNAIWDTTIMPDGDPYFALATELSTAGYTRLYRYRYETNEAEELFRVEDVNMPSDRAIRASKFHTSIGMMNDGRMVMTTHTTDKSPLHPTWMPINYYHHIWEGYAGSNIVVYDPKTGKAENLGIPVPHESIYGALYDPKTNALFFTGYMKGHLYRYSFDDGSFFDFGQTSENYAFRLLHDGHGNILGSSRSGWYYLINTSTLEIKDLNYRSPLQVYPEYGISFNALSNGAIGPDGRLYVYSTYSRQFLAYDPKTRTFEEMGDYLPTQGYTPDETRHGVYGMDFDTQGILWYAVFSRNCGSGRKEIGLPSSLFCWDIARGGKPEWLGLIGTKKRVACWTSEVCINDDDIMFVIGSNHATDGPDITAVDLKQYRKDMHSFGFELTEDEYYVNRENKRYLGIADFLYENLLISEENNWQVPYALAHEPLRLWRALAPDHIDDSPVKALCWLDDRTLCGVCGNKNDYIFAVIDGKLDNIKPEAKDKKLYERIMASKPGLADASKLDLPYYPGRQYKAKPALTAQISSDRVLVATEDGMLAIIKDGKIFALGPAMYNGPVRDLSVSPDRSFTYGVGGDIDDIGMLFRYDDESGLRWIGHITYDAADATAMGGAIHCPVLTSCDISPDGKTLAIGSGDRLGTLMFYIIPQKA